MTNQVRNVTKKLMGCGLKRNEFCCRAQKIYRHTYKKEGATNPYDFTGYCDILIWNSNIVEKIADKLVAAGFNVTLYTSASHPTSDFYTVAEAHWGEVAKFRTNTY